MLSNDRASSTCAPVGRGLLNHSLSGIPNTRPIATRPTNQRSRRRPSNARPIHTTASMPSATARSPSMSPIHAKLAATEPSNDCAHSDTERSICNVFGPLATYPSNANHIASTPIAHQGTVRTGLRIAKGWSVIACTSVPGDGAGFVDSQGQGCHAHEQTVIDDAGDCLEGHRQISRVAHAMRIAIHDVVTAIGDERRSVAVQSEGWGQPERLDCPLRMGMAERDDFDRQWQSCSEPIDKFFAGGNHDQA